jgi:hypothetical protein
MTTLAVADNEADRGNPRGGAEREAGENRTRVTDTLIFAGKAIPASLVASRLHSLRGKAASLPCHVMRCGAPSSHRLPSIVIISESGGVILRGGTGQFRVHGREISDDVVLICSTMDGVICKALHLVVHRPPGVRPLMFTE